MTPPCNKKTTKVKVKIKEELSYTHLNTDQAFSKPKDRCKKEQKNKFTYPPGILKAARGHSLCFSLLTSCPSPAELHLKGSAPKHSLLPPGSSWSGDIYRLFYKLSLSCSHSQISSLWFSLVYNMSTMLALTHLPEIYWLPSPKHKQCSCLLACLKSPPVRKTEGCTTHHWLQKVGHCLWPVLPMLHTTVILSRFARAWGGK